MKVWLVKAGEPLPITGNERLLRTGTIAEILLKRGHEVTWWTSTFDHARRKQRFATHRDYTPAEGYRIKMLWSPGYRKSVSLARLWDHRVLGEAFRRAIQTESPPDIVLCALPTLELSTAAVNYGEQKGVPVVLDLRDMWPDIFVEHVRRLIRPLVRSLLRPWFEMLKDACSRATAIIGITDDFVDWGLRHGGRARSKFDRAFPLAYRRTTPGSDSVHRARRFWMQLNVSDQDGQRLIFCFFGSMGYQLDMETVIKAARKLEGYNVQFVLCGSGDNLERFRNMARDCTNVLFPGWVGTAEIWTLMQMSAAGIAPYRSSFSFMQSIPNKAIEYLAGGLPIITSLDGRLKSLVQEFGCGYWYPNGKPEDLVSIIMRLRNSPNELKRVKENAAQLYNKMFDADKVYGELTDHLEEIVRTWRTAM